MQCELPPPKWALKFVIRVSGDYDVEPPRLHWNKRKKKTSSGYCMLERIDIGVGAGSDKLDVRLALIHEMAHHILLEKYQPPYNGEHNDRFYDFLWPLIRRYHFPMKVALEYEKQGNSGARTHRQTVTRTYRRAGGRLSI